MKRVLFLIPIIVLLMGFTVKAESYQDVLDYLNGEGIYINTSSNAERNLQSQVTAANNYYNNSFGIAYVIGGSGSSRAISIGFVPKSYIENMTYSGGYWKYNNNNSYTTQCSIYYCTLSGNNNYIGDFWLANNNQGINITMSPISKYGKYDFVPPIDWINPQYNPNMPIPEFTTNYGEISVNSSGPEIPFDIEFVNPSSDYFIEIYVNYWIPDNMSISINRNYQYNDGFVYKALSKELVGDYIIDPEQMIKISGINNFKLQLKTSWENALNEVPDSSIEYANPNNLPSGMFEQYKNTYENYCRSILGFYGSQFTIMMRYFSIVNDTEYVIGAWRTWTTYSPNEFTERIPDYYVPYVPASGQENITNDVDPENVSVVSGTGTSTGVVADPNYYITVNQNTPNYPDYPTIASYNKDNLLLDTINQMNSLSTFFGQFGEFLTMSFSFFPAWIWAIIGVGFSISIVVMFLKIL